MMTIRIRTLIVLVLAILAFALALVVNNANAAPKSTTNLVIIVEQEPAVPVVRLSNPAYATYHGVRYLEVDITNLTNYCYPINPETTRIYRISSDGTVSYVAVARDCIDTTERLSVPLQHGDVGIGIILTEVGFMAQVREEQGGD